MGLHYEPSFLTIDSTESDGYICESAIGEQQQLSLLNLLEIANQISTGMQYLASAVSKCLMLMILLMLTFSDCIHPR